MSNKLTILLLVVLALGCVSAALVPSFFERLKKQRRGSQVPTILDQVGKVSSTLKFTQDNNPFQYSGFINGKFY